MAIRNVKDKAAFKEKVRKFFSLAEEHRSPKTIPALAEHLGWMPEDIIGYPKEGGALSDIINFAKLKCENWLMEQMVGGKINKEMAGMLMKMHFGYSDSAKKKDIRRSIRDVLDGIEEK